MAKMFAHFDWSSRTVDTNDIGVEGVNRGKSRCNFGTGQHAAGEFHRDLHLKRDFTTLCSHSAPRTVHGGLHGKEVEHGFNDEKVDTAFDQCPCLRFIVVSKFGIANLTEGRKASAWTDGAGDPAGLVGC